MKLSTWKMAVACFLAAFASCSLIVMPAMARVDHEQAFNLCIAQPALQSTILRPMIEDLLSRPHDPALDGMSEAQILNASQYQGGNICAAELVAHLDVFSAVAVQQFVSGFNWENAWVAVNTWCRHRLTGTCISQEVEAAAAIRAANTQGQGTTPSSRACSLVLSDDIDPIQWKKCMDVVGDQHPEESVILDCAVPWHSQKDGILAGRKIGRCFKRGG